MKFITEICTLCSGLLLCPIGTFAQNMTDSLAVVADTLTLVQDSTVAAVGTHPLAQDSLTLVQDSLTVAADTLPLAKDSLAVVADTLTLVQDSLLVPVRKVNLDSLHRLADSLRMNYSFQASCDIFDELLAQEMDSIDLQRIRDERLTAQNGLVMSSFVATPKVVAKKRFPLGEFYLYYPLEDKSWRSYPNVLDTSGARFPVNALYFPEGSTSLYYSAHDETGARNIYHIRKEDSLWTVPALLNEDMTSASNDIFPLLSADRKKLFFSSDGLFGAGGYDLYVSEWDEERKDWGEPENMGFPYSSPANDYLYMDSEDGRFSIFASDRECSPDSVWVYVLEYDNLPVRKEIEDPAVLKELCTLKPEIVEEDSVNLLDAEVPENLDIRRYMDKITQVNALRDTIFAHTVRLDQDRNAYAVSADEGEMEALTRKIDAGESAIRGLTDSLTLARKQLQDIEMEFLFSGVVIDPQKLMEEADKEEEPVRERYSFDRLERGEKLVLCLQEPEVRFDYTFRIEDTSSIAESNMLPEGLVYQIQMMVRKTKAGVAALKGISPVFEIRNNAGTYTYKAGVFNTYKDALSKLNLVKRKGFRYAKIVASEDGKTLSIAAARELEKQLAARPDRYEVLYDGETLPVSMMEEIKALSGKDVAKGERNGKIMYIVGPFEQKEDAELISAHLRNGGAADVVLHEIGK